MASSADHRDIGRELDLFSFHDVAPGAPFWHPNGMIVFRELERYARKINDANGFDEISTPIMVKDTVFKQSGHWDHYRENMFWFVNPRDENETLVIKPMNCPESTYVYNSTIRSYRDLPLRLAEIGRLHRNELSGTLGGLFRVRQITMDDAHIYVRPDQVEGEVISVLKTIEEFYALFGFKPSYVLATMPEFALGTADEWKRAERALENALSAAGAKFEVAKGEGAFYGPKIEVHMRDSQGRDWQLGTAQLDLVMLPRQFELSYADEDGSKKMPWVIHRAIFGSFERFLGILLEETGGNLPVWLSPVQAAVLSVSDKSVDYAAKVVKNLRGAGIRTILNADSDTLNKKIRDAEVMKIPYILVVGPKEAETGTANVRERDTDAQKSLSPEDFIELVHHQIP
ncbi:MAG: threonine--tRNA ligase [Candidatus Niyogibacteria bacterium]|nr:threonine--tRNA ligase [Candidatus Niyogibacteria bacterium]